MRDEKLEKKITIINEALLTGASATSLAKKYGGSQSLISKWLRDQKSIVHECLVYVKLADEGKFQILLEKNGMTKAEDKKTLKDYKRENEYLKTKLAYYEELAKQSGVDLTDQSKKTVQRNCGSQRAGIRKHSTYLCHSRSSKEGLLSFSFPSANL